MISRIRLTQAGLVRAGTLVWLMLGVVLLATAARGARTASTTRGPAPLPVKAALTAAPGPIAAEAAYVPDYEFRPGTELVMVFIGASFCGAQRTPGFPQAVERAKVALAAQARSRGMQFRTHAVSLDWKTADALAFLAGFGAFDEISVGSNWLNDGAVRYIWRDLPGDPAVPQVLILQRTIDTGAAVSVRDERLVRRIMGADPIATWAADGARI